MPRLLGINPTKAGRILLASLAFVFVIYMLFGASSSNKIELTESNLETVFRFSSNEDSLSKFSLSDYKLYSTEGQELYPSKECCIQLSQANIQKLSSKILERSTMFYQRNLNHLGDNIASWNLKSAKAENFLYYAKLFPAQNAILVVRYEKPEDVDHSALDSKVSRTLDSVTLNSLLAALNQPANGQNGAHLKFSTKYHKKEDEEIDNALKKLTFKNSKVQVLRGAGAKGVSSPPPDSIILERVLDAVIESFPEHGISLKITQSDLAILRGAGAQGTAGPPDDHSVLRGAGAQGTAGPPDDHSVLRGAGAQGTAGPPDDDHLALRGAGAQGTAAPPDNFILARLANEEISDEGVMLKVTKEDLQSLRGAGAQGTAGPPDNLAYQYTIAKIINAIPEAAVKTTITVDDAKNILLRGAGAKGTAGSVDAKVLAFIEKAMTQELSGGVTISGSDASELLLRGAGAQGTAAPPDNRLTSWVVLKLIEQTDGMNVRITADDILALRSKTGSTGDASNLMLAWMMTKLVEQSGGLNTKITPQDVSALVALRGAGAQGTAGPPDNKVLEALLEKASTQAGGFKFVLSASEAERMLLRGAGAQGTAAPPDDHSVLRGAGAQGTAGPPDDHSVLRGAGAQGTAGPPDDDHLALRGAGAQGTAGPPDDHSVLRGAGAQGTAGPPDDHSILRGAGAQGTAGPPDNFILAWTAVKLVEQMGGLTVPITQLDVDTWTGISNSPWIAAGIPSYMHNSSWGYQPPSSGSEKVSTVGNDTTSSTGNDTLSISAGGNVTGSGNSSLTIDSSSSIGFGYTSETLNRTSLRGRGASGTQGPPDSMTVTLKKTDILGKVDSASASDPYTELLSKILDQNIPAEGTQVKTSVPEYLMLRTGHSVDLEGKINR